MSARGGVGPVVAGLPGSGRPAVGSAGSAGAAVDRGAKIEELRLALVHMSGAERRLRGRDHSRPGELTYAQVRTLAALGREGEMTAGQLARSADLNPASVTAMLDHLEEADIVQRNRSTQDRRVCNVSLTPTGWELLEAKLASWQSRWEEKLAEVSDRDLLGAVRVIAQITELYQEIGHKLDDAEPRRER